MVKKFLMAVGWTVCVIVMWKYVFIPVIKYVF